MKYFNDNQAEDVNMLQNCKLIMTTIEVVELYKNATTKWGNSYRNVYLMLIIS